MMLIALLLSAAPTMTSRGELPDPFLFADGRRVQSVQDWQARRAELQKLILDIEYGQLPPPPTRVSAVQIISHTAKWLDVPHHQHKITCDLAESSEKLSFVIDLLIPKGDGPFPVILRGDWGWRKLPDDVTKEILSRGYILAEFNRLEFAPDLGSKQTDKTIGLWGVYPDREFGALAAWAWGYHRAVDFLVTQPYVDKKKIAITGHSRGGKTVLLAGATDQRVALTAPNNSGCGGAGCYRFEGPRAETMERILTNFPFWFSPRLKEFVGREQELPFDQHSLKALVAPRALLSTEALDDLHANPSGSLITHRAAREVYKFLGQETRIAIAFRPGGHEHNLDDFRTLLDFADEVFFNKKTSPPRDWNADPFGDLPTAYTWSAPQR